MFRSSRIVSWIYGFYAWTLFLAIALCWGGLAIFLRRPPRARRIAYSGAKLLFFLAGMRLSAKGLHDLPGGTHVLVINHGSFLDGIALTALLPPSPGYAFVVRQEFAVQRLLCPLLKSLGTIVLNRVGSRNPARSNVKIMSMALLRKKNILVFPEGEFSPEPGLKSFHSGAFVAAASANVPIVVAVLRGIRDALPPGTWLPRRIDISLEIGPVLMPNGMRHDDIEKLKLDAHGAMSALLKERD